MGNGTPTPAGAGPYSTGDGGVVLEHCYGAVLLSHLLARTPVPGLGDAVTPHEVRFQAKAVTPVDDLIVSGQAPNGATHRLSIAVRRRPKLIPSEPQSVQLVGSYLTAIADHWPLLHSRRWQLALAVAPLCLPAHQLKELAVEAAAAGSNSQFRSRMTEPGRPNAKVRARLSQLDALVRAALAEGAPDSAQPANELTWRLLARLTLVELRLEGADRSDRTHAVARLQRVTPNGFAADGDMLFTRLVELAGVYAPSGAIVDLPTLQGDLRDLQCMRDPDLPASVGPQAAARPSAGIGYRSASTTGRPKAVRAGKCRPPQQRWTVERKLFPEAGQPQLCDGTLVVRDGYMLHAFDAATGSKLWGVQSAFNGRPVLGGGAVYTADRTSSPVPRDLRTGRKRAPLSGRISDGLAVYDRGTLYGPSPDGKLHALDTVSGACLWRAPDRLPAAAVPPQITATTVFAVFGEAPAGSGSEPRPGGHVLALDPATGRPRWLRPAQTPDIQQWTATDLAVYLVQRVGVHSRLAALDAETGAPLWDYALHDEPTAAPLVAEGTLYLAGRAGHVYAIQATTGRALWVTSPGRRITAPPILSHGLVLVGSWDPDRLSALDARTGEQVWSKPGSGAFASAPVVDGSTVWAAHRAGVLQAWDVVTGRQLSRHEDLLWDPVLQGEPVVDNGNLYVTTLRGELRCLSLR